MGCHFLLQGIFLTQGLNPCLFMTPALAGRFFITSTRRRVRNLLPYEQPLLAAHPCPPVLSTSQPNRKSKWFMCRRHTLITFLKVFIELRHWDKRIHLYPPQTSHISTTGKQSPDSVGTSQGNQVGRFSGSQPQGTLCQYVSTL